MEITSVHASVLDADVRPKQEVTSDVNSKTDNPEIPLKVITFKTQVEFDIQVVYRHELHEH